MKFKVRVQDELFEVEIGDLRARPIVAVVEGERIELWPEAESAAPALTTPKAEIHANGESTPRAVTTEPAALAKDAESPAGAVRAPIPGVITHIAVQPGAEVVRGDEICALDAMKMKNIIRSPKAGKIAAVFVNMGQSVKHGDVLATFEA